MSRRNLYNRVERDAQIRRDRAHAHLSRVRSRGARGTRRNFRIADQPSRRLLAAALIGGLCAGVLWGDRLLALGLSDDAAVVDTIAVRGAHHLSAEQVAIATGVAPGSALSAVEMSTVKQLLEDHDWIATASAVRFPGGAIVVEIVERMPRAAIALGTPPESYAVDATGIPFAVADSDSLMGLPVLVVGDSVAPREANARLAEAVHLAYRLPELGLALPAEISIASDGDPEGFALRFNSISPRFVLGRRDLDERLDHLARLLSRHSNVVAGAENVDLRFADQVVLRDTPTPKRAAAELGGHPILPNRRPAG
jgi:cell division septal protein FtsQ